MKGSKPRIIEYMKKRNNMITSMEAFTDLGITRLSARIKELRDKGYIIDTMMINGKNRFNEDVRFGVYVLKGEPDGNESVSN